MVGSYCLWPNLPNTSRTLRLLSVSSLCIFFMYTRLGVLQLFFGFICLPGMFLNYMTNIISSQFLNQGLLLQWVFMSGRVFDGAEIITACMSNLIMLLSFVYNNSNRIMMEVIKFVKLTLTLKIPTNFKFISLAAQISVKTISFFIASISCSQVLFTSSIILLLLLSAIDCYPTTHTSVKPTQCQMFLRKKTLSSPPPMSHSIFMIFLPSFSCKPYFDAPSKT